MAFYGGPDQIMTVTSGLAGLVGVLLMFWHRLVGFVHRAMRVFHRPEKPKAAGEIPPARIP